MNDIYRNRVRGYLADNHGEYVAGIDPYRVSPSCRYDHHALVAYAEKVGKSINDLSIEEKARFIER